MTHIASPEVSVAEWLRGYSIEVNPSQSKVIDAAVSRLKPGTQVFLTWIPGSNPMDMVEPATRLRQAGLIAVPHIGARHLENAAQLAQLADRLVHEAGVDRVLIIGGDRPTPAGPYDSSLAVMQTGIFQTLGVRSVAVAGFPEGNPNISETILDDALDAKLDFGRRNALQLSIVTQFCFRAEPIVDWLRRIRTRGIDLPVRIGLAGPAGLVTLMRYAVRCGIGNSLHVLTEHPSFAKLLIEKGPEPIIRGIAESSRCRTGVPLRIAGLHFFVFGGFNKTVDWINSRMG